PSRLGALVRYIGKQRIFLLLAAYTAVVVLISVQGHGELRVLLIPALLWLTFQVGSAGVTLGLMIQAVVVTACLTAGIGPAGAGARAADELVNLQLGLVLNALCA